MGDRDFKTAGGSKEYRGKLKCTDEPCGPDRCAQSCLKPYKPDFMKATSLAPANLKLIQFFLTRSGT